MTEGNAEDCERLGLAVALAAGPALAPEEVVMGSSWTERALLALLAAALYVGVVAEWWMPRTLLG